MTPRILAALASLALLSAACTSQEGQAPTEESEPATPTAEVVIDPSPAVTEAEPTEAEPTEETGNGGGDMPVVELDCMNDDMESLDWVACNVIASLETQNTQPLMGYMSDPFGLLYWRSEGISVPREQALAEIENDRLPVDPSAPPSFSTDPAAIPSMMDTTPSDWLGPDVEVELTLYSRGWGTDGGDEAMLFFTRDAEGAYRWSHLFYAMGGFER